mmetsp:Transcript_867/g.1370  ORF Transcript_867/g.1370 Transcript_867/m.1370 type:complete len:767 (-) Transcript_867:170-2470(-)
MTLLEGKTTENRTYGAISSEDRGSNVEQKDVEKQTGPIVISGVVSRDSRRTMSWELNNDEEIDEDEEIERLIGKKHVAMQLESQQIIEVDAVDGLYPPIERPFVQLQPRPSSLRHHHHQQDEEHSQPKRRRSKSVSIPDEVHLGPHSPPRRISTTTAHNTNDALFSPASTVHSAHSHVLRRRSNSEDDSCASVLFGGGTPVPQSSLKDPSNRRCSSTFARNYLRKESSLQTRMSETPVPRRTIGSTFVDDAKHFRTGTIPQSIVLAFVIGTVCGVACYVYYLTLFGLLRLLWDILPNMIPFPPQLEVLWIPIVSLTMAFFVGVSIKFLGEPGDLAFTISCVHEKAYVPIDHVLPMLVASLFSILGGGSLGPEAPLVAICAALGGYVSRNIFHVRNRNVVRKHTLMGMAGALAAFFGCPLGGSLFALEVNSRFGVEYFEHMIEAIFCGEVTLCVFRSLSRLPIKPIWTLSETKIAETNPLHILMGAMIGLLGAFVAYLFATLHYSVMAVFAKCNLVGDDNKNIIPRVFLGSLVFIVIGMFIPQTLFWGEEMVENFATLAPYSEIPWAWPKHGLIGFENVGFWNCLLAGFAKLVCISFTVAAGFRGGFIFPLFAAGSAFGRALVYICPFIPPQMACLCFAAGLNVAITRTSLASTLILCYLSGEPNAISAVLASSLVSLFATSYMKFIKTQIVRSDIDHGLYRFFPNQQAQRERNHGDQELVNPATGTYPAQGVVSYDLDDIENGVNIMVKEEPSEDGEEKKVVSVEK